MNETSWEYKPIKEIKNFKDLELEKQRLQLHQQFLGELLVRDKHLLQKAIEPKQLFTSMMNLILSKSNLTSSSNREGSLMNKIIGWIVAKIFK